MNDAWCRRWRGRRGWGANACVSALCFSFVLRGRIGKGGLSLQYGEYCDGGALLGSLWRTKCCARMLGRLS